MRWAALRSWRSVNQCGIATTFIPAAQAATLIAMVGGEREVFETARPVLAAMTREQFHLGGNGAGQAMKLGINSMIATTNLFNRLNVSTRQQAGAWG